MWLTVVCPRCGESITYWHWYGDTLRYMEELHACAVYSTAKEQVTSAGRNHATNG